MISRKYLYAVSVTDGNDHSLLYGSTQIELERRLAGWCSSRWPVDRLGPCTAQTEAEIITAYFEGEDHPPQGAGVGGATGQTYFYRDVPGHGNVVLSRHAQARQFEYGFSDEMVREALYRPGEPDFHESEDVVIRQRGLLRLVILTNPYPNKGARLVKTVIRVGDQARAN